MIISLLQMLDLPVMPNVVTLFAADIYQIQNCLDETHLPNLKHLTLDKSFQVPGLSLVQQNSWRRHQEFSL